MNDGYLDAQIRRTNRNMLTLNVVIVGLLLLTGVVFGRYYYNFFRGPFPIANEQFDDQGNSKSIHEFFTVDSINLDPSPFSLRETDHGNTTTYPFYEMTIGNKQMLVKMASTHYNGILTGGLTSVPSEITAKFDDKDRATYYPQMIDATNFRSGGVVGLIFIIPTFIIAVWNILKSVGRMGDPSKHPLMRQMALMGDPRALSAEIDRELAGPVKRMGVAKITDSWVLQEAYLSTSATRVQDMVWAYKKVTTHRTNGVQTGKTYTAVLRDRYGKSLEVPLKEAVVGELLNEVIRRAPWAVTGFDKDIQTRWTKDRANFVAAVDARRQKIISAPPVARPPAVPMPPPIAGRPVTTPPPFPATPPVAPPPFPSAPPAYAPPPPSSFPPPRQTGAATPTSDEPEIGI